MVLPMEKDAEASLLHKTRDYVRNMLQALSEGRERAIQRPPDMQKGSYCSLLAQELLSRAPWAPRELWVKFRLVSEHGGK